MAIYSSIWFWMLIIGILVTILGVASFLIDSISTTIAAIALGVGILLMLIGGIVMYTKRDRKDEKERQMDIRKGGEFLRGEIQENVPYYGTVSGKLLGETIVQVGDASLVAATTINNLISTAFDVSSKSFQKVKRIVVQIIVAAVLAVLTAGVGSAVVGGVGSGTSVSGIVGSVGTQIGSNISSATIQQLGTAIGKELLQTGVTEGIDLATKGAGKAVEAYAEHKS